MGAEGPAPRLTARDHGAHPERQEGQGDGHVEAGNGDAEENVAFEPHPRTPARAPPVRLQRRRHRQQVLRVHRLLRARTAVGVLGIWILVSWHLIMCRTTDLCDHGLDLVLRGVHLRHPHEAQAAVPALPTRGRASIRCAAIRAITAQLAHKLIIRGTFDELSPEADAPPVLRVRRRGHLHHARSAQAASGHEKDTYQLV
jgi:hypothetical protein